MVGAVAVDVVVASGAVVDGRTVVGVAVVDDPALVTVSDVLGCWSDPHAAAVSATVQVSMMATRRCDMRVLRCVDHPPIRAGAQGPFALLWTRAVADRVGSRSP